MALTPGTRLGPYDVVAPIGVGGMGEVYRARDTTLNRDVALKVLPDAFAQDADRLARFTREAQTLAALNHPNIAQIYGLEGQAGPEDSGAHPIALVMELVEGEDLSQRIARGPIPLDEALPIAKQIAEALEAAHERGIIHRDLKPANIKVRADGTVKVLDFGLAKAMDAGVGRPTGAGGAGGEHLSQSPTITTPAMTQAGMIMGTAAYMSPEQARGGTVDRRADLWAFGAVLWEMLTGMRLFEGLSVSDTVAAVLKTEPPWGALPAETPPSIRKLLRRCLEKDRRRRLADAADARLEVDDALLVPGVDIEPLAPPSTRPVPSRPARVAWTLAGAAVLGMAALAVPAARYLGEERSVAPVETRLDVVTPATSDPTSFALSPDGQRIVFVASADGVSRLWQRPLSVTTAEPLAGTEGALDPFWSPDSRSIGFFAEGKLKRLDLGVGLPQTLVDGASPRGGTWNSAGVILFVSNLRQRITRVAASGGAVQGVTELVGLQGAHRFPVFLPGGRQFLFDAQGPPDSSGIYLGSLDAPATTKRLTPADSSAAFVPPGWLLFVRQTTLVAQRVDLAKGEMTGTPVTIADRVGVDTLFHGAFSVSAGGLVAYRSDVTQGRRLSWFSHSGKMLEGLFASDENGGAPSYSAPVLSPDEQRVAAFRTGVVNLDIWLLDATRATRFTFDPSLDRFPVWSPDGRWVAFDSNRDGPRNLYQKASSGTGPETLLVKSAYDVIPTDWSRDGEFIVYQQIDPQTSRDIWVAPLTGDRKPVVFLKTPFDERQGRFSPDGHWMAFASNQSGRYNVYVRPFSGRPAASDSSAAGSAGAADGQWQVSTSGGMQGRWSRDGRELYFVAPDGRMMAATVTLDGAALRIGTPTPLFQTQVVGGGTDVEVGTQYDVSRDGRFLMNVVATATAPSPITLIQHWNPEAKK